MPQKLKRKEIMELLRRMRIRNKDGLVYATCDTCGSILTTTYECRLIDMVQIMIYHRCATSPGKE